MIICTILAIDDRVYIFKNHLGWSSRCRKTIFHRLDYARSDRIINYDINCLSSDVIR